MAFSKIILNGTTLIDLTSDTVATTNLISPNTAHDNTGESITGQAQGYTPPTLQSKTATPTESSQTIEPDSGYDGLSDVTVGAISPSYVGSGITRRSSTDLTASGATVTVPSGYYSSQATKSVANGSVTAPSSISGTSATVSAGTNTLTLTKSVSVTPNVTTAGYISSGTAGNSSVSLTASVNTRSSSDLTASGATVTAPAGYYSSQATKTISSGTEGTPTATKGSVSNNSISVTPSVTNTAGYISGSTKTGTAVSVSASELVSGSLSITSNNTYDVTNYASAIVNVSGSGGIGTLLNTTSIGTVSTTSTQQSNLNKDLSVSGINDYDLLIVESSVDTLTASRHAATIRLIFLTGSNSIGTKNGSAIATATLNIRVGSNTSTFTSNSSTTAYGVYANSCSISSGTATIPMYRRYNSTSTGTLNGTYTARVYGVKLKDLIGG